MDQTQLLKGVLELAVLAVIAKGETYGYEILSTLEAAGLDGVGDASVYGTLRRLEQAGQLSSRLEASDSGPARKYYSRDRRRTASSCEPERRHGAHISDALGKLVKPVTADEYVREVGARSGICPGASGATSSPISAATSPNCRPRQISWRGSGLPRSTPPISALRKASSVATGSAPTCAHGARATSSSSRSWSSYSHSRSDSRSA